MKTLVIGGGGFLGKAIVRRLLARGETVRVFGRHEYPEVVRLGAECVCGDVRNLQEVADACHDCDVVLHTAAMAAVWGAPEQFFAINTQGTANVIRGCIDQAVPHLVYTSSPSVVFGREPIAGGDESLPYPPHFLASYPASKAQAEARVLQANGSELRNPPSRRPARLRTCALRPHLIWGPEDPHLIPRLVAAARTGRLAQVGDGRNRVDVTYVENAAEAHVLAMDALMRPNTSAAGRAYFVGDAEPVILWDWIRDLLGRLGLTLRPRTVPYPLAYGAGAVLEAVHRLFPTLGEPRMTRFVAAQLAKSHWFSHAQAERDLGYHPIVDNETGLRHLVAWLRTGTVPPPHKGKERCPCPTTSRN